MDHAKGVIDVYNQNFTLVKTLQGNFQDPNLPAGADPFNIQNINGQLYVEYTVKPSASNSVPAPIQGAVNVFNTDGQLVPHRLIDNGALNDPWGVALAPANFGQFSNDLLVGNFGDGHINAFNPNHDQLIGQLTLANGQPFEEDHLWALQFGNGAVDNSTGAVLAPTNTLYFTAGINGEKDGLFGSLQAAGIGHRPRSRPAQPGQPPCSKRLPRPRPPAKAIPTASPSCPKTSKARGFSSPATCSSPISTAAPASRAPARPSSASLPMDSIRPSSPAPRSVSTPPWAFCNPASSSSATCPTSAAPFGQGSLQILDANGNLVMTLANSKLLDGPWDLTINDQGNFAQVFVSNVLSGTVTRIDLQIPAGGKPQVLSKTQIASGYAHRTDPQRAGRRPDGAGVRR